MTFDQENRQFTLEPIFLCLKRVLTLSTWSMDGKFVYDYTCI